METKLEKFERLAESRTNNAIDKIRLIGNLANKNNYNYTKEHLNQIFSMLEEEIKDVKNKFEVESKKRGDFKFQ